MTLCRAKLGTARLDRFNQWIRSRKHLACHVWHSAVIVWGTGVVAYVNTSVYSRDDQSHPRFILIILTTSVQCSMIVVDMANWQKSDIFISLSDLVTGMDAIYRNYNQFSSLEHNWKCSAIAITMILFHHPLQHLQVACITPHLHHTWVTWRLSYSDIMHILTHHHYTEDMVM